MNGCIGLQESKTARVNEQLSAYIAQTNQHQEIAALLLSERLPSTQSLAIRDIHLCLHVFHI